VLILLPKTNHFVQGRGATGPFVAETKSASASLSRGSVWPHILSLKFRHYFQHRVPAVPQVFSDWTRHNNASWRLLRAAVYEETAPSERLGARGGLQPQYVGTMFSDVDRRPLDAPTALRNRSNVVNRLHVLIVLAVIASRITVSHELAVLQQFPRFLRVTPHDPPRPSARTSKSACVQCWRAPSF
jgi:hypothetical protein